MNNKYCLCCGKPIDNDELWHHSCIKKFFNSDVLPSISFNKDDLKALAIEQVGQHKAVQGVQEKLSLGLNLDIKKRPRLTVIDFPSGYILKPQSSTYKQLPEFEQTAMLLADLCKIQTVPHGLIPINEQELAYITKRIDRKSNTKIHMEDFCQASNNITDNKYRSSYEECVSLIEKYSSRPQLDKVLFFKYLYFNFVIGNSDVHLKNFSFIMNDKGELTLSPLYDLLPTKVILPTDHDDLGMLFNGRKNNLHKHDFDQFATHIGIEEKVKDNIINEINKKENDMYDIIDKSSLNQNARSTWKKMIHSNINRAKLP